MDSKYTSKDITILTDREHVRQRTNVYFGNMNVAAYSVPVISNDGSITPELVNFIPAAYKAVGEILDNAIDEFSHISIPNKVLTIKVSDSTYTISDNGRGVPIDKHASGGHTPEIVFGSLRSGRNFTPDTKKGIMGVNGVGAACTNYCSSTFSVEICRDGKKYVQTFSAGAEKITPPVISKHQSKASGTSVTFTLDPLVFSTTDIPYQLIQSRAKEIALTNPGLKVICNDVTYMFKRGFSDVIPVDTPGVYKLSINEENVSGEIFIITNTHQDLDEQMYTWVNSSYLFDGGKWNTQLLNCLSDNVISHLDKHAKRTKTVVTKNDVKAGLTIISALKVKKPEYDSQSKTRLTGPDLRKEVVSLIEGNWKSLSKKLEGWLGSVLERAESRHHKQVNKQAQDQHERRRNQAIPGLLEAIGKDRSSCQLMVTEGESASSKACEVRDPEVLAAFSLTGKINNVYGCTTAEILNMKKLANLLLAIGLTPGKRAVRSSLRYGKIIIATDADHDGSDILTLLVNMFYQCWPELFDPGYEPIIYRLQSPNICAVKGKNRVHFSSREEFERVKSKYKGWEIKYFKGLGSMELEDWEMILQNADKCLLPILDDGKLKNTLTMLFNDDSDGRKQWLMETL